MIEKILKNKFVVGVVAFILLIGLLTITLKGLKFNQTKTNDKGETKEVSIQVGWHDNTTTDIPVVDNVNEVVQYYDKDSILRNVVKYPSYLEFSDINPDLYSKEYSQYIGSNGYPKGPEAADQLKELQQRECTDLEILPIENILNDTKITPEKLVTYKGKYLEKGKTYYYTFLDLIKDDTMYVVTNRVKQQMITAFNLVNDSSCFNFQYTDNIDESFVRVTQVMPGPTNSYVGLDNGLIQKYLGTLNVGWMEHDVFVGNTNFGPRHLAHEVGHVTNKRHEHLNNDCRDTLAIMTKYKNLGWTESQINATWFSFNPNNQNRYGEFNPTSLMAYGQPCEEVKKGCGVCNVYPKHWDRQNFRDMRFLSCESIDRFYTDDKDFPNWSNGITVVDTSNNNTGDTIDIIADDKFPYRNVALNSLELLNSQIALKIRNSFIVDSINRAGLESLVKDRNNLIDYFNKLSIDNSQPIYN